MALDHFSGNCRNCGCEMHVKTLECPQCDVRLEGNITLPRLARLSPDDREFIELFVLSGGSLKEVGKILQISYPTVRNRLDTVIKNLKAFDSNVEEQRMRILAKLQNKEISSEEALKLLNNL